MKTPTLEPRRYKIDHDANDYAYFVVWMAGMPKPWTIQIPGGKCGYMIMTLGWDFDYQGPNTAYFDTAEEALNFWNKYIEVTVKQPSVIWKILEGAGIR